MGVREDIAKLASDLIRFQSVKDRPDELKKVVDFIENYFSGDGFDVKRFEHKEKHSILLLPKGAINPKVLLAGHADVVEADYVQFTPRQEGNRLFGRGAADMKGGVAIFMLLLKKYKGNSLGLLVTTDEELGGFDGVGMINKEITPGFAIATEPTNMKIITKEKGVLWLKLIASGKSCHASRPWLGDNAADTLIDAYLRIKQNFEAVLEDSWKTTINLGVIKSGKAANIVPDSAEAMLDIRYTEDNPADDLLDKINGSIADLPVKLEVVAKEPLLVSKESDFQKKLELAFEKAAGKEPNVTFEHGASDLRFFSEKGVPCALLGPEGANWHGKDEFLDLDSAEQCYNILDEFLSNL